MAINDILSDALIRIGLKKSEQRKLEEAIEASEERIRTLYDRMEEHIRGIQELEAKLKALRKEYENSSNSVKEARAMALSPLMKKLKDSQEERELIVRSINLENDLLRNYKIELEHLLHPSRQEEIMEAADNKSDIVADLRGEDKAVEKLNGIRHTSPVSETAAEDGKQTEKPDYDALDKELDALLGQDSPPDAETPSGNSEKPLNEA